MKVYRRIILDIKTGSILYEDSYEYSGKIAECKGGGGSTVTEYQSPEQRQIYAEFLPIMQQLSASARGGPAAYDIPQYPGAPTAPSMQGTLSGVPPYQISQYGIPQYGQTPSYGVSGYDVPGYGVSGYGVPNIQSMMPSQRWYSDLSPEVMAGIRAPYEDASKQLTESLGYSAGSPMAGASGVLGGSQAKFWADAGTQMGQQAWNMVSPALQQGWQAGLGQNQYLAGQQNLAAQNLWGADIGRQQNIWGAQLAQGQGLAQQQTAQSAMMQQQLQQERQADYQNILAQQQAGYAGQQNIWTQQMQQAMLPYTIAPGLMGGAYSSPVVNQSAGGMDPLMGAGLGAFGGYYAGGALGGGLGMGAAAGAGSGVAAGTAAGSWAGPVGMGLGALLGYYLSQ